MNIGKVYKITCDCGCDKIYIGSTFQKLCKRMTNHITLSKHKTNICLYSHMEEVNNRRMFKIILIREYKNISREKLRKKEHKYIVKYDTVKNGYNGRYAHGQICEHNRRRTHCKECGGSQICEHNRRRSQCTECNGDKYKCEICDKIYCSKSTLNQHMKTKKHLKNLKL